MTFTAEHESSIQVVESEKTSKKSKICVTCKIPSLKLRELVVQLFAKRYQKHERGSGVKEFKEASDKFKPTNPDEQTIGGAMPLNTRHSNSMMLYQLERWESGQVLILLAMITSNCPRQMIFS